MIIFFEGLLIFSSTKLDDNSLLKRGRYQFFKLQGKYGNKENPVLIINIPKKELLYYGDTYKQESVIYGEIPDYRQVTYEYWERNSEDSPLIKKDEVTGIDILENPDDFYSSTKGWNFTIPFSIFQESLCAWYNQKIQILNEDEKNQIKECVEEIVQYDERYTGHHYYKLRGRFNSIVNGARNN